MSWLGLVAAAYFGLAVYAHYILRGRRGAARGLGYVVGLGVAVAMPWLAPADQPTARFFVALWSFLAAVRLADVAWDKYPAPQPRTSFGWFLFTWICGPDTRWARDDGEVAQFRRAGRRRLGRGVLQVAGALGMFAMSTAWPELHEGLWTQAAWALATTLFLLPGGLAVITGGAMAGLGLWVEETFDNPGLSRSPRDFWSRRWNRLFQAGAQRHIFRPLLRRRRPMLGFALVFGISAVLHEYLVLAAVGEELGLMTAFFGLHGVATFADWRFRHRPKLPRPVAIALHTTWFWAGFPLFMIPVLRCMPIHELRLW